jgi:hypothetical protein
MLKKVALILGWIEATFLGILDDCYLDSVGSAHPTIEWNL